MSKLAKFFIICGAACVLGIGLFAAGIATGGVHDINKVAEKYQWMSGGPGPIQTEQQTGLEFDSINVDGTADIMVAGPSDWAAAKEMVQDGDGEVLTAVAAGDVVIRWGKDMQKPNVSVEKGVLTIYTHQYEEGGVISMNFTTEDCIPDIVIFCSEDELNSIRANDPYGDMDFNGINFASGEIITDNGDASFQAVSSGGLNIQSEGGDVDLNGTFTGETTVTTSDGDVEFETSVDRHMYTLDVYANGGDVTDGENDNIGSSYKRDGGENLLKIRTYNGDIDLWFGDTLF